MCVTSMIGDHYRDTWKDQPWYPAIYPMPHPGAVPMPSVITLYGDVTRAEFEELKRQVTEMKALLIRAKKYDEDTGQKHCEMDDKVVILKKVAALVGISLEDVLGK